MVDGAARSANQFTNILIKQAFPQAFHTWGYLHPHNPNTFEKSIGKFDSVVTVVRNPIDSVCSHIHVGGFTSKKEIIKTLNVNKKILESTLKYKEYLTLFSFEEVTTTPSIVGDRLSARLALKPVPYSNDEVTNLLNKLPKDDYYAVSSGPKPAFGVIKERLLTEFLHETTESLQLYKAIRL